MDKAKLARLPDSPGIYIFKDKKGRILYIGKARSLRKRAGSYFTHPKSLKIQIMTSKVSSLDYIVTESEAQARLEEAKLIKEKLPPYNTALRDDKSFPIICISNEDFPVVWVARRKYIEVLASEIPASKQTMRKRIKIPVYRYFGPYTNAGLLRQALKSIRHIFTFRSCSKMPKTPCLYYRLSLCPAPCIGKISIKKYKEVIRNIILLLEGKQEDLLEKLTVKMHKLASEKKFEEAALVRNQIQALSSLSTYQYLGDLGVFEHDVSSLSDSYRESKGLKRALGLNVSPARIEAFDVSNIVGTSACASMVSFYEGRPDKSNYRRFRIRDVFGINDYKMLEEAVSRRYHRLIDENLPLPDLIIVDGGKGQLNIVKCRLKELGLTIQVISIAKPPKTCGLLRGKQEEKIYLSNKSAPVRLKSDSLALRLIQRIRDEAHRFALAYHHILRRKEIIGK